MSWIIFLTILCSCSKDPQAEYRAEKPIRLTQPSNLTIDHYRKQADLFIAYLWPTESYYQEHVKDKNDDYQQWMSQLAEEIIGLGDEMATLNREIYRKRQAWDQQEKCLGCQCVVYGICERNEEPNWNNFDACFEIESQRTDLLVGSLERQSDIILNMQTRIDPVQTNEIPNWITTSSTLVGNGSKMAPTINWDTMSLTIPLFGIDENGEYLEYSTENKTIHNLKLTNYTTYQQLTFDIIEQRSGHLMEFELDLTKFIGKLRAFGEITVKDGSKVITRGFASMEFQPLAIQEYICRYK